MSAVFNLRCKLDKGMFSDEVAVSYPQTDARKSVFVPYGKVIGNAGQSGTVVVKIIRKEGRVFAILPSSNNDIVEVRNEDLEEVR